MATTGKICFQIQQRVQYALNGQQTDEECSYSRCCVFRDHNQAHTKDVAAIS